MRSLNPETKAYQIVYEFFAQQIYEGKLKLGSRLPPERDISEALSVSRNSVREGIRMLEMLGFVESRQGSGNYIRSEPHACMTEAIHMMMVLQDIKYADLHQTRRALELEALEDVHGKLTEETIRDLRNLLSHMDECDNADEFYFLERSFHRHLIVDSGNELFIFLNILTTGLERRIIEDRNLLTRLDRAMLSRFRSIHHTLGASLAEGRFEDAHQAMVDYFDTLAQILSE